MAYVQSFEGVPGVGYTLSGQFDDGGGDYFGRFGARQSHSPTDGSFLITGEDHDGDGNAYTQTVTMASIDISGMSLPQLTISVGAENDEPVFPNFEVGDGIKIYAQIDGGLRILVGNFAVDSSNNGDLFRDLDLDGVGDRIGDGDGQRLVDQLRDFKIDIPGTGSLMTLEVEMSSNNAFEQIGIDHVRVDEASANAAPVVTIEDETVRINQWHQLQDIIAVEDLEGDQITQYELWDDTGQNSWYADGARVDASAGYVTSDLSGVYYQGDASASNQSLYVRAFDGETWGAWDSFTLTTELPTAFQESFENGPGVGYTLSGQFDDGVGDYFGRFGAKQSHSPTDGSFLITGKDHDGDGFAATQTVTLNNIDIDGFNSPQLTLAIGADSNEPAFDNFEGADGIEIFATIDGGARTLVGAFKTNDGSGDLYRDTDLDGVGDGQRLVDALQDFQFYTPGSGDSLKLEIEMTSNNSFEQIGIDNVRVDEQDANAAPVVILDDLTARKEIWTKLEDDAIFADLEGDQITQYELWDDTGQNSWYADGMVVDATAGYTTSDLSDIWYQGDATAGAQTLYVRANDGQDWGDWKGFTLTTEETPEFLEDFEDVLGNFTLSGQFDDGGNDYFGRFAAPKQNISNADGTSYITGEDHDGDANAATQTVTHTNVDIEGFNAPQVTIKIGAENLLTYEASNGDGIKIYATVDGGTRTLIGEFAPQSNASGRLYRDTDGDGFGDGSLLTAAMEDHKFDLHTTGKSVTIETEMTSTFTGEQLAIDTVRVAEATANDGPNAMVDDFSAASDAWTLLDNNLLNVSDIEGDQTTLYELWDDVGANSWYADGVVVDASTGYTTANLDDVWAKADTASQTLYIRAFDGEDWGEWDSFDLTIV